MGDWMAEGKTESKRNKWIAGWMDVWKEGQIDGWMNRRTDRWIDGWMNTLMNRRIPLPPLILGDGALLQFGCNGS